MPCKKPDTSKNITGTTVLRMIRGLKSKHWISVPVYILPATPVLQKDSVENMKKVLREMEGISDRKACFRTVIALIQGKEEHLFEGRVDGKILTAQQGEAGFGYDPIFQPEGFDLSFAEMPMDEKK